MKIFKIANKIKFYHGSYDQLPNNTVLSPDKGNFVKNISQNTMDSHFKLEQFKPPQFLSRNNCVYMTNNIDDLDSVGAPTDHIYLVKPLGKVEKHDLNWMTEIDIIFSDSSQNNTQEDNETIEKIKTAALNYWNGVPHYNESAWEYLTPSAIIIKEVY
jgi:hypothetical protein